jgi:hypothetical protein
MIIQRRYKEVLCYLITCAISGGGGNPHISCDY